MRVSPDGGVVLRIAYFGQAEAGKVTNLQHLQRLAPDRPMAPIDLSEQERGVVLTIRSVEEIGGKPITFEVVTLSGRSIYAKSRQALLADVDGVVFVADARREALDGNIESMNELNEFLQDAPGVDADAVPLVIQLNKTDLPTVIPTDQLAPLLNYRNLPMIEAVATEGKGVTETWKTIADAAVRHAYSTGREHGEVDADESPATILICHQCEAMLEVPRATRGDIFSCGSCNADLLVVDPDHGRTQAPSAAPQAAPVHSERRRPGTDTYHLQTGATGQYGLDVPGRYPTGELPAGGAFMLSGFEMVENLDDSVFGARYLVKNKDTGVVSRAFVPNADLVTTPDYHRRIDSTIKAARKIHHPNLLPISGVRWEDRTCVILSHYAPDYEPLGRLLARRRTLQIAQSMAIVQQVALGLEEAARPGVIHGYVRPECVLVGADGQIMLDDLGVPKPHQYLVQNSSGGSPTTEYYLAPEHLLAEAPSDLRTDVFLLGALLHRLLTGEGLVTGYNAVEALNAFGARDTAELHWNQLPRNVEFVLNRMTAIERRERYQSHGELISAFEPFIENKAFTGSHAGTGPINVTSSRRRQRRQAATYRTAVKRRSGARVTGAHRRTGPVTGNHRRTGPATGTHRRGATVSQTGSIRRGSQSIAAPARSRVDAVRHERQRSSALGPLLLVGTLLVIAGLAIYFYNQSQQREVAEIAEMRDRNQTDREEEEERTSEDPAKAFERAREAVDRFSDDPTDDGLQSRARSLVSLIPATTEHARRKAHLLSRINAIIDERDRLAEEEDPPDGAVPPDDGEEGTVEETPPDEDASNETARLSAVQKAEIVHLRREQRFAAALDRLEEWNADQEMVRYYRNAIAEEIEALKLEIAKAANRAKDRTELRRAFAKALDLWGLPDQRKWAENAIARLAVDLPEVADASGEGEDPLPAPPDTGEVIEEAGTGDAIRSPAGFLIANLEIGDRIVEMMRAFRDADLTQVLKRVDPDSEAAEVLALQVELWRRRHEVVAHVAEKGNAKLRVTNPVDGKQWDVVGATADKLVLYSPTGGKMDMAWSDVSMQDLGQLFVKVGRIDNLGPESRAIAAVAAAVAGRPIEGAIMAKRAAAADYERSDALAKIFDMQRDREILALFAEANRAITSRDHQGIGTVIEKLEQPHRIRHPMVQRRVKLLKMAKDKIAEGGAAAPIDEAGAPQRPARTASDRLSFDQPEERLSFPDRGGAWSLKGGLYISDGQRCHLIREDCGNAWKAVIQFKIHDLEGAFHFTFRGTRLLADLDGNRLVVDTKGGRSIESDLPLATNTLYTAIFALDETGETMGVTINQAEPLELRVGDLEDELGIHTDTGARIALDEIRITRGQPGQEGGKTAVDDPDAKRGREDLRALGYEPIGETRRGPDGQKIVLPGGSGARKNGLAINLQPRDQGGIRLKVNGQGQLWIRPGSTGPDAETGSFTTLNLPSPSEDPVVLTANWRDGLFTVRWRDVDGEEVFSEKEIPEGASHILLFAKGSAVIQDLPETLTD